VLTPPDDLSVDALVAALTARWEVTAASIGYRPVGFGSHHWELLDAGGTRWFVTVDELDVRRHSLSEPLDVVFERLRAALGVAIDLRDSGCAFVAAPVPTRDGEPLARLGDRFSVALFPFLDGQSYSWGEFSSPAHRRAVLDLVVAVHAAPDPVRRRAMTDEFALPHRDELEADLHGTDDVPDCGPYARPAALLVAGNAAPIRRLLARYDRLVVEGRAQPSRMVLTHGEPHPGNTMLTSAGWRLIDWDSALVAPPERDLWSLDPGDGSILDSYADRTGVPPLPSMLELYRLRWDLADLAVYVSRFRRPHTGSRDDDQSWDILRALIASLSAAGAAGAADAADAAG